MDMKNIFLRIYRNRNANTSSLLLRVVLGILFANAGWIKITNLAVAASGFASMGFAPWMAGFVGWVEFLAGILIIVGILIKPSTVALAVTMAVVVFGLSPEPYNLYFGHDYQFVLLVTLVALYFIGAGKYSLAHMIQSRKGQGN